jgi:hypothetical protein
MSNLSGLPPQALARLNAQTLVQDLAVRLTSLPDTLRSAPQPLKLSGVVTGQNADGSVQVQTDKGVIGLLLKDRQALPQGMRLQIDLPAGNPPQQASIRQAPAQQSITANPSAQNSSPQLNPASAPLMTSSNVRLDRMQSISPDGWDLALKEAQNLQRLQASQNPATLQAGQLIKLIPNAAQTSSQNFNALEILGQMIAAIENAPEDAALIKIKTDLLQLSAKFLADNFPDPTNIPKEQMAQFLALRSKIDTVLNQFGLKAMNGPVANASGFMAPNMARPLPVILSAFIQQAPTQPISLQNFMTSTQSLTGHNLLNAPTSQMVVGQVSGSQANGFPTINFLVNGQMVSMTLPSLVQNFPQGSPLFLSILPNDFALTMPHSLGQFLSASTWDSMNELLFVLNKSNPIMAQNLSGLLPNTNNLQQFSALSLLFLSALRTQSLDQYLGGANLISLMKSLDRTNLSKALNHDLSILTKLETMPLQNDWRASFFPFYHEQNIHKLPVFYKEWAEDARNEDEKKRKKMMRFLFDLKLSRMGDVQVDGFYQKERLDLILRTTQALSPAMQQQLKVSYAGSMERSQLHGEMSFQFKKEQFVDLETDIIGTDIFNQPFEFENGKDKIEVF